MELYLYSWNGHHLVIFVVLANCLRYLLVLGNILLVCSYNRVELKSPLTKAKS